MEAIVAAILAYVRADIKNGRPTDVSRVARDVHNEFPKITLDEARIRVLRAVALAGGDFK
jgi:hypothetical protein